MRSIQKLPRIDMNPLMRIDSFWVPGILLPNLWGIRKFLLLYTQKPLPEHCSYIEHSISMLSSLLANALKDIQVVIGICDSMIGN